MRAFFHGLCICQVHKVQRENKTLLKMWNAARASLLEAERADWSGEGDPTPPRLSLSTNSKVLVGQEQVGEPRAGRRSVARARRSTTKGATPTKASKEKDEAVLTPPDNAAAQGLSFVGTAV